MLVDYVFLYLVIWPDILKSSDLCVNLILHQYLTKDYQYGQINLLNLKICHKGFINGFHKFILLVFHDWFPLVFIWREEVLYSGCKSLLHTTVKTAVLWGKN